MFQKIIKKWVGAGLLIAGSTIGIGMLAMPIATGVAGFIPSALLLVFAGLFMAATALLLIEVDLGDAINANLLSLAEHTLGKWAKYTVWVTYLFLFYCLMIAYTAKGGDIFQILMESWSIPVVSKIVPTVLLITLVILPIFGGRHIVDLANRILMIGLFISYGTILFIGLESFETENLAHLEWIHMFPVIPFVITAYGFHNMIPTITDYLSKRRSDVIKAVLLGTGISFTIYFLWTLVVQAAAPYEGENGIAEALQNNQIGTELLYMISRSPLLKISALYLSLFAIVTSMLGQGISLVDFLYDGIGFRRNPYTRLLVLLLIFLPSLGAAFAFPGLFFLALELVGGLAAIYLFGLLPACMAWTYRKKHPSSTPILPGGTPLLFVIALISLLVMSYQLIKPFR